MTHNFMQFAYVTNDFDLAVSKLQTGYELGEFKEMRDLYLPTGPDRHLVGHYGLAFKDGIQFEIIQPIKGDIQIYQEGLEGDSFKMFFHHLGRHIYSEDEYLDVLTKAKKTWNVPIEMQGFGGYYAYADARETHGHYLEFFCFPEDTLPTDIPFY